jgi:hypothetical protein
MTIINNIEIDNIEFTINSTKMAIANNNPIEEKLNVIIVISNPCLYAKRYILLKEFVKRIEEEEEEHVKLFIVELVYSDQKFIITSKNNKNHLQLKTEVPLWHKENMINLGVKYLLPKDYKAFAWIDADVEFDSCSWVLDTLKILNGHKDIVQLFSHCIDMDKEKNNLNIFNSFGYCFEKQKNYTTKGTDYWHPGYAWAITRKAYEKINGLYDKGILGSGDSIIAMSLINKCNSITNINYSTDYNNSMLEYQKLACKLRLGYTPGIIRHYYHGSKINRKYTERWKILMKYNFSPLTHIIYDSNGLIIPASSFSQEFKDEILNYFKERKEDE